MNLLPLFSSFEWAYSMGLYLPVSLGFYFFSFLLFLFISFSSSLPFPSFHSTVLCTNTKLWMWNIHSHTSPKLNQSLEFDTSRTTTKVKKLYLNIYSCNFAQKRLWNIVPVLKTQKALSLYFCLQPSLEFFELLLLQKFSSIKKKKHRFLLSSKIENTYSVWKKKKKKTTCPQT